MVTVQAVKRGLVWGSFVPPAAGGAVRGTSPAWTSAPPPRFRPHLVQHGRVHGEDLPARPAAWTVCSAPHAQVEAPQRTAAFSK